MWLKDKKVINIEKCLLGNGYSKEDGALGEKGLTKIYSLSDGLYCLWVTIDLLREKIYFYKEYNCGGKVSYFIDDLTKENLISTDAFIKYLNNILNKSNNT